MPSRFRKDMNRLSKIRQIMSPRQRASAGVLLLGVLVATALEMLGVSLVLPVVALILSPDSLRNNDAVVFLFPILGDLSDAQLVLFALGALIAAYVVKTAFMIFISYFQFRFVYSLSASVSLRLMTCYLRASHLFHVSRNSSHLLRNMTSECTSFQNSLEGLMILSTELTVVLGLCALLLFVSPTAALVSAACIASIALIIDRTTRKKITSLGAQRLSHEGMKAQYIMQGLGAVKEIKLLGREDAFLRRYQTPNYGLASAHAFQNFIQAAPRFLVELIVVTLVVIFVFLRVSEGSTINEILPTLGLFGAAAFRLLPSMNRILAARQKVRFMAVSVDVIFEELKLENQSSSEMITSEEFEFRDEIIFESVYFAYPDTEKNAISDLDLKIKSGETLGIMGGSGAGKSTFVDLLLGLLEPSSGSITLDNRNIAQVSRKWQRAIGYVPQDIRLTDESIMQNVALGIADEEIDVSRVISALKAAQLLEHIESLPEGLNTRVGERGVKISGGQRQRLGIARALYQSPKLLILDEATSALDSATEAEVMAAVGNLPTETTVLIVAHRISTMKDCDRVVRFEAGRIDKIMTNSEFRDYIAFGS